MTVQSFPAPVKYAYGFGELIPIEATFIDLEFAKVQLLALQAHVTNPAGLKILAQAIGRVSLAMRTLEDMK